MRARIVGARNAVCIVAVAERKRRSTITRCELAKRNRADAWTVKVCEIEQRCASVKSLADSQSRDDQDRARAWFAFTNLNRNTRNREGVIFGLRLKNSRRYSAVRYPIHWRNRNDSRKCDPTRKNATTGTALSRFVVKKVSLNDTRISLNDTNSTNLQTRLHYFLTRFTT